MSDFKKKTDLAGNDKIMWSISRYEPGEEDEMYSFNIIIHNFFPICFLYYCSF